MTKYEEEKPKKKQTFYKSFTERLKEVNVDAVHRVRDVEHTVDTPDSSNISQCLKKLMSLDFTVQYKSFVREVFPKCKTYKMVIHYQSDIVTSLEKHLRVSNTLALNSLLKVLVAVSADLGPDFYPNFFKFFPILTNLLKTDDTDKMENIFVSITLLFRNLWRYMIDDMEKVIDTYKSLLVGRHPVHISSFAAESISFLLRKMRDPKQVLVKLFDIVKDNPQADAVIAKVLFYMMKGSQNQFHSKTEYVLPLVLQFASESNAELPTFNSLCTTIEATIKLMAEHTLKEYSMPVWKSLLSQMEHCTKSLMDLTYARNLVKFMSIWCTVDRGQKVVSSKQFIGFFNCCLSLMNDNSTSPKAVDLYTALCELVNSVLVRSNIEITVDERTKIFSSLLENVLSFGAVLKVWMSLVGLSVFTNLYMELFLKFCQNYIQFNDHKLDILKLIVRYSLSKMSLPQDSTELENFQPLPVDFTFVSLKHKSISPVNVMVKLLNQNDDWCTIWYCLVALFSIKPLNSALRSTLTDMLTKLFDNDEASDQQMTILSMCCQLCYKLYGNELFDVLNTKQLINTLFEKHSCKHFLMLFDVVAFKNANFPAELTEEERESAIELLEKNLSSPDPVLRRLSLRALLHVDQESATVYESCVGSLDIPATFLDARSKIMSLNKLQLYKGQEYSDRCKCTFVRFLTSHFYINFSSLWDPVQEVLRSYAVSNSRDPFWTLFVELLSNASATIQDEQLLKSSNQKSVEHDDLFDSVLSGNIKRKDYVSNERIDYVNYRELLWKTLITLPNPNALEHHLDDLMKLLYDFLKKEFFKLDKQLTSCDEILDAAGDATNNVKLIKKASATALMVKMLTAFARFSFLKKHANYENLLHLFRDFLGHSDDNLQRSALKCILNDRNPILLKYREQLNSFLDENKFSIIINQFAVDDLSLEERPVVLKMLLQILFGKMKSKEKIVDSKKASSTSRRTLIVRFLCGLSSSEIDDFFQMLCQPHVNYMNSLGLKAFDTTLTLTGKEITKVLSIPRQQGTLKCIKLLVVECHHKFVPETFSAIFKMLLQASAINRFIIESKMLSPTFSRAPKLVASLRNVNKQASECILDIFKLYPESFSIDSSLIDMFFNLHVWPELSNLVHQSSGMPGFLLKAFRVFAERPMFMPLLGKLNTAADDSELSSPLEALTSVLVSPKCSSSVGTHIMEMLFYLVFGDTDSEDVDLTRSTENFQELVEKGLDISGELFFRSKDTDLDCRLHFGLALLIPFVDKVLTYLIVQMKTVNKKLVISSKQLQLLLAIGKVVDNEDLLSDLTELLLDHVISFSAGKSKVDDDEEEDPYALCLQGLSCVMRNTKHIDQVSKLFSKLNERQHRVTLVSILQSACQNDPEFAWTCQVVTQLNAWERRKVNQIDYESRLIALENVLALLKSDDYSKLFSHDCQLFLPIVHCCAHTLRTLHSDLSLRESVVRVLELMIKRVDDLFSIDFDFAYTVYEKIIQKLLLRTIEKGLKSSVVDVRSVRLRLLSLVVSTFPNEPCLLGLNALITKGDIEQNTFESLRHMQVHRQARGMRRISALLRSQRRSSVEADEKAGEVNISARTVSKFLLPVALQTLYHHKFVNADHYRDECIDLIKAFSEMAPWPMYKKLLVKTLNSSEELNHLVVFKVACALLEAFPHDFSKYKWRDEKMAEYEETLTNEFALELKSDGMETNVADEDESNEGVLQKCGLSPAEADKILNDITMSVLPNLHKMLSVQDKKNPRFANADVTYKSCDRKLPYALPIVMLLKKLPLSLVKKTLPSILLNVFAFLKHKNFEVRSAAINSTTKMLQSLGPSYFNLFLRQLRLTLPRGFQRHVLLHATHCMFESLLPVAKVGVFDDSLTMLLNIMFKNLFGPVAEEKNVEQLKHKIPELRGTNKAYHLYTNVSKYIEKKNVTSLIQPLKEKLNETHSFEDKKIIARILEEVAFGLLHNEGIRPLDIAALVHALMSENISFLFPEPKKKKKEPREKHVQPESCLLLGPSPGRYGEQPVAKAVETNLHILVEFALNMLKFLLKKNSFDLSDQEHMEKLDPFVAYLVQCLSSLHAQTVVGSIECLTRLYRTNIPSMRASFKAISEKLFKITQENAKGMGSEALASASFHSLSELCVSEYGKQLSFTQLKILLAYAEEDMYDSSRQAQSFKLIRSIINKGLRCKEVSDTIDKVRSIAIQSQNVGARAFAGSLYMHFLTTYPMPDFIMERHFEFILTHLTYEYEDGRLSALDTLASIVKKFPEKLLDEHAGIIFVPTAAAMINDESEKCRKEAGLVIKVLLSRLNRDANDQLFSFVLQWFGEEGSTIQQRLGAMLICIFAEVSETEIERHVVQILPILLRNLQASTKDEEDENLQASDQTKFHLLSAFLSLLRHCKISRSTKLYEYLVPLFDLAESMLTHMHNWIQLVASQIFGCVFAEWDPNEVTPVSKVPCSWFAPEDLEEKLLKMVKCFCDQLKPKEMKEQLAEQVIKNLLYIARVFDNKYFRQASPASDESTLSIHKGILLILRQLSKMTVREQTYERRKIIKRTAILKFCAAFCVKIDDPDRVLHLVLDPISRCLNSSVWTSARQPTEIAKLRELAQEVLAIAKTKVDPEVFPRLYMRVTQSIEKKRGMRKEYRDRLFITDPAMAAKRKIQGHQKKRTLQKRKAVLWRPERGRALTKRLKMKR